MRHIMLCISGWAGTGKDECTGQAVRAHSAVHTGLADPGKRHLLDTYGFTLEQLWGPSKFRNEGDPRYPKPALSAFGFVSNGNGTWSLTVDESNRGHVFLQAKGLAGPYLELMHAAMEVGANQEAKMFTVTEKNPMWFLSPRECLQMYMELMNTLYADTWIRKGIDIHKEIVDGVDNYRDNLAAVRFVYDKVKGVVELPRDDQPKIELTNGAFITCFSDFRHIHEHRLARLSASDTLVPVLVRIKRPTVTKPPFRHRSETEQTRIRDAAYDFIIQNDGTLSDLHARVDEIIQTCSDPNWVPKKWSPDLVLSVEQETYQP